MLRVERRLTGAMVDRGEELADDEERNHPHSLRGLLARLVRNTSPQQRKRPDPETGRREVRGD